MSAVQSTSLGRYQISCPECGAACDAEYVDVGVGMLQCEPYHCDFCGWVETACRQEKCLGGKCLSYPVCLGRAIGDDKDGDKTIPELEARLSLEYVVDRLRDYPDKAIDGIFNGRKWIGVSEFLGADIPAADKLRVILNSNVIPDTTLHEFACWCGDCSINKWEAPDQRSVDALAAKRAWMRGDITLTQLREVSDKAAKVWYGMVTPADSGEVYIPLRAARLIYYATSPIAQRAALLVSSVGYFITCEEQVDWLRGALTRHMPQEAEK